MTFQAADVDRLCVNTIRTLSIDAIQKANSGHPGMPLGAAPMAYVLWKNHLRIDPKAPAWPDRDRFVLSGGHGSMLQYSLLHLTGFEVSLDDIKNFRQWGSLTPGHPEAGHTPGIEVTTGPLGQGATNSVGLAIVERHLAHRFNREGHTIVDHHTFAIVTDGDLMEGIVAEAAAIAGHLKLGKLIWLYDSNDITLDGPASMHMTENMIAHFNANGWHTQRVEGGDDDLAAIDAAIVAAKAETGRPSLIEVKTTIGFGSPKKAGTAGAHGSPLGADEVAATKVALGWDPNAQFFVPQTVAKHLSLVNSGQALREDWERRFTAYSEAYPELAGQWERAFSLEPEPGFEDAVASFPVGGKMATRVASGKVLNGFANVFPFLLGGDADLSCSTKSSIDGSEDFNGQTGAGRNIRFGVREHAMAGIVTGMSHHGGVLPYASTFFCFADYMRPSIRLAALDGTPAIYVWTHDSVAVGEDGPTHQPIEHLMSLRCMPNLVVLRPGDAEETREAWRTALLRRDGPTALVLSRQDLPTFDRTDVADPKNVRRGAYVLKDSDGAPEAVIIATGSEVHIALAAQATLASEGRRVRVVSMPSWELYAQQDQEYRDAVLPPSLTARVSVEAGTTFGWAHHVGDRGTSIGIDRFGASAPGDENLRRFGFTAENIAATVRSLLG